MNLTTSLAVALIAALPISAAALPANSPNIVIILADDLGRDQIDRIGSPQIADVEAEGVVFRNAYAGSALCAPSRAALLTGYHTGHVTPRGNRGMRLDPSTVTIAEMLAAEGYATGMFGKWGFGYQDKPDTWPEQHGWDEYLAYLSHVDAHDHTPPRLWQNGDPVYLSGEYAQDIFDTAALDFIDRHADQPFLLYVSSALPHVPLEIPGAEGATPRETFAAMVRRFGQTVGTISGALDAHGISGRTLMIVTSDNGANWDDASAAWASNLRGKKGDLYEGGINVPMIARWPGRLEPGVTDRLVAAWDIYATAADLANVHKNSDGLSILLDHPDRTLYFELHGSTTAQALRWNRWKAIRHSPNEPLELYDLESDPEEKNDLAEGNPDLADWAIGMMAKSHMTNVLWPMRPSTWETDLMDARRSLSRWIRGLL